MSKTEWRELEQIVLGKEDDKTPWYPCIIKHLGKEKVTVDWIGFPGESKLKRSLTQPFKQQQAKGQRQAAFVKAKVCLGKMV